MKYIYPLLISLLILHSSTSWGQEAATPPEAQQQAGTPAKEEEEGAEAKEELSTPRTPPRNAPRFSHPRNTHHKMQLLASNTEDQEAVQWIESESETFFALWYKDRSGDAKGAVLVIHAEGEHPAWPHTTQPLHESLPDYGWATMALQLDQPYIPRPPERTLAKKEPIREKPEEVSDEQGEEKPEPIAPEAPTNQATPQRKTDNTEVMVEQRLSAALKFLHEKGQFNIVIMGSGTGAIRAHRFIKSITPVVIDEELKDKLEKPIRASIIFNARNHLPDEPTYKDWFFDPEIPVLDIYTAHDLRNAKEARARKILGKQKKANYHAQVRIKAITHERFWRENQLSRRVRSFLDAYLQGIEVNKTAKN